MKKQIKTFIQRGLLFGGFGPIIAGIVYFIISLSVDNFILTGSEVLLAIISTYILAFVQAGASIFNQIEGWGIAKSLLCHLSTIYIAYVLCYIINSWIPFDWVVILIFTAIFVVTYLVIWLIVYLSVKTTSKEINKTLNN